MSAALCRSLRSTLRSCQFKSLLFAEGFRSTSIAFSSSSLHAEFDESLYRNEVHVVGKALMNPSPRYAKDTEGADEIGYEFPIEVPTHGNQKTVCCNVRAYTYPDRSIAEYVASNVRQGHRLEIFGFFRKTSIKTLDLDGVIFDVHYSIGPKFIRILEEKHETHDGEVEEK